MRNSLVAGVSLWALLAAGVATGADLPRRIQTRPEAVPEVSSAAVSSSARTKGTAASTT